MFIIPQCSCIEKPQTNLQKSKLPANVSLTIARIDSHLQEMAHLDVVCTACELCGRLRGGLLGRPPFAGALGRVLLGSVSHKHLVPSELGLTFSRLPTSDPCSTFLCRSLRGCTGSILPLLPVGARPQALIRPPGASPWYFAPAILAGTAGELLICFTTAANLLLVLSPRVAISSMLAFTTQEMSKARSLCFHI
jgi:hypothetical protein